MTISAPATYLPVLEYLRRQLTGQLKETDRTHLHYPTAISWHLGMKIVGIDSGYAEIEINTDPAIHGNQQGTVHGGLLAELCDAAIGTAHSTLLADGESFTSLDLNVSFLRPVWTARLRATARRTHPGRNISRYHCEIQREDGKLVATATSTMMTLRGQDAAGR